MDKPFIHIDKPILNRQTPEENLALVDKWISDTADKLNYYLERSREDGGATH